MNPEEYFMIDECFGSIFSNEKTFKAKTNKQAIKQYLKMKGWENKKVVYDSTKNSIYSNQYVIVVQKGCVDGNTHYVRGKRYYYKII